MVSICSIFSITISRATSCSSSGSLRSYFSPNTEKQLQNTYPKDQTGNGLVCISGGQYGLLLLLSWLFSCTKTLPQAFSSMRNTRPRCSKNLDSSPSYLCLLSAFCSMLYSRRKESKLHCSDHSRSPPNTGGLLFYLTHILFTVLILYGI